MNLYIKFISLIILGLCICSVSYAAKYYRWVDENGNARITRNPPPKDQVVQSVEIIDTSDNGESATTTPTKKPRKKAVRRNLPKKNIIPNANLATIKKVMSGGTWVLRYDRGGVSRVSYKTNNKYTFRGKDKIRTYLRNGTWKIYQRKGKWYLSQKGKYTTKTKFGKTYSGQINERYILTKLTGRELVMYDAKYRNRKLNKDYMIIYRR